MGAEKNFNESPVDKDNHAIDAFLYLIQALEQKKSYRPEEIANRRSLQALTVKRNNIGVINCG